MRKRIGIYFASEEALALLPGLESNPDVELGAVYDPDPDAIRERLRTLERGLARSLEARLTSDLAALAADPALYAVVDASPDGGFAARFPDVSERGVQIVTPLVARLLWGFGGSQPDRKAELLQALHEVVESYNLTVDADELFRRMLEIALGVTGAEGGSLMLLDAEARELRVRVAAGVEPELWPKIRVKIGEGIAGRVAADARPLRLRGKADRQAFHIVRERLDIESALCVPLVHEGRVLGVLNLHHTTRPDAFSDADLEFTEQLAHLDAKIIARAQEHEAMRNQAARYGAVREVRALLGAKTPLPERLHRLCLFVALRAGRGIVNVYLHDPEEGDLKLAASSLEGGGLGGEYRVPLGQGVDGEVAQRRQPAFLRGPDGSLAYAALPLVAGDALAGVLSIQTGGADATRGRALEETLLEVGAAAAEEIAAAQREARIATRATKVGAINETGLRMIAATDPAEVLRLGTSSAAMVLEADHAILRLKDEDTGRFVIRSYFGSADGRLQQQLFRLDKRASVDAIKRRTALLVRDVSEHPTLREGPSPVRSLIAAPLRSEGRVTGTLAIYDKVAADRFTTGSFSEEDLQLFTKFASYLERAIANALFYAHARRFRNFDEETGLPNAAYLEKRIQEEIARAGGRDAALALAVCCIENLAEIERAKDAAHARRVVERTAAALREHLRDFDVAGRTGDAEFTLLLPEPGFSPGDRVLAIARSVADDVAKDESLNEPLRVALSFGYAVHPSEGADHASLLARARVPRIRMV
ncbi:MAG TPA: GAF domain-containing protein [Myxococcota bacterium]|jgi:diguanylate cyclase (GGDEF)-like protein